MAYSFQTFSIGEVFTAAKANQIEVNVRDHVHGSGGVAAVTTAGLDVAANIASFLGAADYAAARTALGTVGIDLVAGGTASASASIDLGNMDAASDSYLLFWSAMRPTNDGDDLWLRVFDATLAAFQSDAGDYEYMGVVGGSDTDTISPLRSASDTKILLTQNVGNASSEVCSGIALLQNMYFSGSRNSVTALTRWATDATVVRGSLVQGVYKGTQNEVSKVQLLFSTGTADSGSAALLRVRKT